MLNIHAISTKSMSRKGPAVTKDYDSLFLTLPSDTSKKVIVNAIIEAYDLGQLESITNHTNTSKIKARIHSSDGPLLLSAEVDAE
ncbi:hypothetical protein [Eupransor demetentiae]|uniref:Uncharacterized protein n=1 Tax=Eupransor demetentiae TaxID=3109584 RepID=A0ABM9N3A8_9LACO|nr:hypothetical protein R54876_GBNLAHCA_00189 [Lactobacillaceae bacterium LMG 33000]